MAYISYSKIALILIASNGDSNRNLLRRAFLRSYKLHRNERGGEWGKGDGIFKDRLGFFRNRVIGVRGRRHTHRIIQLD